MLTDNLETLPVDLTGVEFDKTEHDLLTSPQQTANAKRAAYQNKAHQPSADKDGKTSDSQQQAAPAASSSASTDANPNDGECEVNAPKASKAKAKSVKAAEAEKFSSSEAEARWFH